MPFFASPTLTPFPTLTSAPTQPPPPTATSAPVNTAEILLQDNFSQNEVTWGTLTDSDSSIEYDGEALRIKMFIDGLFVWTTPNNETYENIHAEVTAVNNDGQPNTAFGILCDHQDADDSYYYMGFTPSGEYVIAKSEEGQTDLFLTNDDQWAVSDIVPKNAASYRVSADCGNGVLSLYVDGQLIDSVTDNTFTSGGVGLFVWSGYEADSADITFDDFIVTSLE